MSNGAACKVAIVDSGIDLNLYESHVVKYVEYAENAGNEGEYDSNGHGTLCTSAMLSVNPNLQLVVIKVLNEKNMCSDERLLRALNLLKDVDADIINLSLATHSTESFERYKKVVAELTDQGKVVIAATANGNKDSLLSGLDRTIGVYGNLFCAAKDFWYQKGNAVQCVADSLPYLYRGRHGEYELFGGNSKATAIFSGIVSLHMDELKACNFEEKEIILQSMAKRQSWVKGEICADPKMIEECNIEPVRDELYWKVAEVMAGKFAVGVEDIVNRSDKRLYEWGLTRYNAFDIVEALERETGTKLPYSKINFFWFGSLDALCNNIRMVKAV